MVSENDKVYDFDLMQKGGHVKGYKLNKDIIDNINEKLELLADQNNFNKKVWC